MKLHLNDSYFQQLPTTNHRHLTGDKVEKGNVTDEKENYYYYTAIINSNNNSNSNSPLESKH